MDINGHDESLWRLCCTQARTVHRGPGGHVPPPPQPLGGGGHWGGGAPPTGCTLMFYNKLQCRIRTSLVQLLYYCSKCTTYKMYRTYTSTRTFQFAQDFTQVLNKYNYAHSYSRIHIHVLRNVKIAQS